ncbi:MAG: hydrogenase maturation nickel metallochaperone HypA [Anaerolineales bacterium]
MHEYAVTQNIVDIVCRHAAKAGASRVKRVDLVVGELSTIVDDSVQFYYDFIAEGTLAEGAQLCFRRVPIEVECGACGHVWQPVDADWTCPACGQAQARVRAGREFYVESIEVED